MINCELTIQEHVYLICIDMANEYISARDVCLYWYPQYADELFGVDTTFCINSLREKLKTIPEYNRSYALPVT